MELTFSNSCGKNFFGPKINFGAKELFVTYTAGCSANHKSRPVRYEGVLGKDYESTKTNRAYFGDFDPFGDFDLLFGAAKLNLKIADMPIRYRERTYGTTNIQRWKHAWLLFKMVRFAAGPNQICLNYDR